MEKIMMSEIVGIVVAAGLSQRMGKFKQLLPYKGKTVISYLIEQILQSEINEIIVVTGFQEGLVREELNSYPVRLIYNEHYEQGMHTSVMKGVKNLPEKLDGFMLFLGDQPHVTPSLINRLIEYFKKSNKGIVIPSYSMKRGHPVLFSNTYVEIAGYLHPETGLKAIINNNIDDILYLNVEDEGILLDLDTPEDYQHLLQRDNT